MELLFETKMICKKKDCPKWRLFDPVFYFSQYQLASSIKAFTFNWDNSRRPKVA